MERVTFLIEATNEHIDCLLNPEDLEIKRSSGVKQTSLRPVAGEKQNDSPILYTGGGTTELSLKLLFDSSYLRSGDVNTDIRDYTQKLWKLSETMVLVNQSEQAPLVRFIWGSAWNILGVVTQISERLENFAPSGIPRRSWLSINLQRIDEALPGQTSLSDDLLNVLKNDPLSLLKTGTLNALNQPATRVIRQMAQDIRLGTASFLDSVDASEVWLTEAQNLAGLQANTNQVLKSLIGDFAQMTEGADSLEATIGAINDLMHNRENADLQRKVVFQLNQLAQERPNQSSYLADSSNKLGEIFSAQAQSIEKLKNLKLLMDKEVRRTAEEISREVGAIQGLLKKVPEGLLKKEAINNINDHAENIALSSIESFITSLPQLGIALLEHNFLSEAAQLRQSAEKLGLCSVKLKNMPSTEDSHEGINPKISLTIPDASELEPPRAIQDNLPQLPQGYEIPSPALPGERLDYLAYKYYGDPAYWRVIARYNNIVHPLHAKSGPIQFPPIQKRR